MRALLVVLAVGGLVALGAVTGCGASALAAPPRDDVEDVVRGHLDQARFFLRKGWLGDARAEVERALGHDSGALSPEAWWLLSRIAYGQLDLTEARRAAERAQTESRDPRWLEVTAAWATTLAEGYGEVRILGAYEGLDARLAFDNTSPLFDADARTFFAGVRDARERAIVPLPITVGLPVGAYTVNGEAFTVSPGRRTDVNLPAAKVRPKGLPPPRWQIEGQLGGGAWLSDRLAHGPGAHLRATAGLVVGPIVVSAVGSWTPRLLELPDGTVAPTAAELSVGGQLAARIEAFAPLWLLPAVGYRAARIPGVPLDCALGEPITCGDAEVAELVVLGDVAAHVPYVDLGVAWMPRPRKGTIQAGFGVHLIAEWAWGVLPDTATASFVRAPREVGYVVADDARGWSAPAVHLAASALVAF